MIKKVWEHQRIDPKTGKTVNEYTVFYCRGVVWYLPEGKIPLTVLQFILSDKTKANVIFRDAVSGWKRTEYTK